MMIASMDTQGVKLGQIEELACLGLVEHSENMVLVDPIDGEALE